jgi:hypothetical protein
MENNVTVGAATPYRQIRAVFDDDTITVYQAYNRDIASAAVSAQKLHASPLFKTARMSWVKPSWAWMLYRAGYSYKDKNQERILALKMSRAGFIELLQKAVLTHGHKGTGEDGEAAEAVDVPVAATEAAGSPAAVSGQRRGRDKKTAPKSPDAKVQWDPERDVRLNRLDYRSIQIGVPGALREKWTEEWIVAIDDVTERARNLKRTLDEMPDISDEELVRMGLVPVEREFVLPEDLQKSLSMIGE